MKKIIVFILLFISSITVQAQSSFEEYFTDADVFFEAFVTDGRVDYDAIKKRPQALNALVSNIAETDVAEIEAIGKKAFLINVYNLLTIKSIIENGIPDSPLNVDGFFDKQTHNVGGNQVTLNHVEKEMLLPVYNDPRLHFVLVCAAVGCPKLQSFAYVPSKLENQIQEATIETLNNDYFVRIDNSRKKVELSQIFNWYGEEFLAESGSLISYVNQFRKNKIPSSYSVSHYTYDWDLNKLKK